MFHEKNDYIKARNMTHGGRMIRADAIKWAKSIQRATDSGSQGAVANGNEKKRREAKFDFKQIMVGEKVEAYVQRCM
eukprot:7382401-Prymnesium_polylepis.1